MSSSLASLQKWFVHSIWLGRWRLGLLWNVSLPWGCAIRVSSLAGVEVSTSIWKSASAWLVHRMALCVLTATGMLWCVNTPSFFSLILVRRWLMRVALNQSGNSLLFSICTFFAFGEGIGVVLVLFGWSFGLWHIGRWLALKKLLFWLSVVPVSVHYGLLSLYLFL